MDFRLVVFALYFASMPGDTYRRGSSFSVVVFLVALTFGVGRC